MFFTFLKHNDIKVVFQWFKATKQFVNKFTIVLQVKLREVGFSFLQAPAREQLVLNFGYTFQLIGMIVFLCPAEFFL